MTRRRVSFAAAILAAVTVMPVAGASAAPDPLANAISASAAPGHHWTPSPAVYGQKTDANVPVTMSDGTVLRADITYPTDPRTGIAAPGPFPVLLSMGVYGKDTFRFVGLGANDYLVKRGYIEAAVDVRGRGTSGGTFDLFDPRQIKDSVTLVDWAARLRNASGKVGMHGASYLGINQLLAAGAVGPNSPLKAIFPIVSANDVYRDAVSMGGILDTSFDTLYYGGVLPATTLISPIISSLYSPANLPGNLAALLGHSSQPLDYNARFLIDGFLGGPNTFDNSYWHAKNPDDVLAKIVANNIPAYLIGGEYDLFQRGEPLNYAGLQNAWAGRPVGVPMLPGQPTTGRYQLLNGPFTHLTAATLLNLDELQLRWFDTWLKGIDTGMEQTPTPLHYYDLGTGEYANTTAYPIIGAKPTTLYFGPGKTGSAPSRNDGLLSTTAPATTNASDTVAWQPVGSSICGRSQDQWLLGAFSTASSLLPTPVPCIDDDRPGQTGPTALTYSTTPMAKPTTIAGPIQATIYASANTRETEWVVNIEDVAPNGVSKPLTQGALLGSLRAVDPAKSWPTMPYHPYTMASKTPVVPGQVTRYDVEVFPTYATIAPGHRIRVTLTTTDAPHLLPSLPSLAALAGGRYQVQRTAQAPSSVTIPLLEGRTP